MQNLKIAMLQAELVWHNVELNRKNFLEKINQIKEQVDLIILPEMFTTGFSMHPQKIGDTMNGETVNWMRKIASEKDTAIAGSVIIFENNNFYNRFLFVHPSGEINFYDKRHLFTLAGEDKVYESGKEKLIVNYKGWKICPLVCYDLRFPVWARNVEDYDLLIYVANWPKIRIAAWDTLLKARAIENMCYTVGVNRVGVDANNYEYNGHSAA
ncbi:MAG: amidohydrolase, partial [Gelidibacter sp.]|nr:amidohydrolase [Gelidibacter sp.]